MSPKQQAVIRPSGDGFALVDADGGIIRDGFKTRALAGMWGARQHLYERKTPPRRKSEIPVDLADESIKPIPLLARMSGGSYQRFLQQAKAGAYGELYRLGNGFGLKYGNWKRGMAARIVK